MPAPRITFACELSSERLDEVFGDWAVVANLQALQRRVALALADFTPNARGWRVSSKG